MTANPHTADKLRFKMVKSTRTRIISMAAAVGLLLSTLPALANNLQSVKVSQGAENSQIVTISLSEALAAMPMHFTTNELKSY